MHDHYKGASTVQIGNKNKTIDQIMSFEYLGCKITSSGFLEEEVRKQANKAAAISGHLKYPIWKTNI